MEINVLASGSSGNSTYINDGKTALLLDAGITFRELQKGTGFRLSDVSGCLVTHEHSDHSKACKELAKRGMNIFSGNGTFSALGLSGHRFKSVKALETFGVGTFKILPFDVKHDAAEPLGFLIESVTAKEKLLYFSDTAYLKYSFDGLTYIIAECNHGEYEIKNNVKSGALNPDLAQRIVKNHLSVERLIDFLKATDLSRLKEVHLIHLSANNSSERKFKKIVQRVVGVETYVH